MELTFSELKKNLKKEINHLPELSVALLGDNPTQLLNTALSGCAIKEGFKLTIYEAEYNQINAEILNPQSELYKVKPSYLIIVFSVQKLHKKFQDAPLSKRSSFADDFLSQIQFYIEQINQHFKTNIIISNFLEIDENVFGNFSNKTPLSFLYQLRKINTGLMDVAVQYKNLFINDLSVINSRYGLNYTLSPAMYINSSMAFSLDFIPYIAKNTIDIIKAIRGKIKKCLILDLDNTLWGGVIGDDGLEGIQIGNLGIGEAYSQLQRWAKQLKERGIILAVCSKNNEEIAKEPFIKHPEMVLRLDDIAVFVANWNNKAENIQYIQSVLNIGFDSMVFIDDNPAERKMVRDHLPDVTVPELPEDPAMYLDYLQQLNLFETATFTDEDADRTRQYQEEAKRVEFKQAFVNEEEYLKSLNMVCNVSSFQKFDYPRVAQLTQRSNQFNLRTIRYNENEIESLATNPDYITLQFKLGDMFGDYGLVSVIILKKLNSKQWFIDTWLMSCRVLKRGLEQLVLNTIVEEVKKTGAQTIIGEYIPTAKNAMVKDHYANLGFKHTLTPNVYELDVNTYIPKTHQIASSNE
jgi:FkbH-like protein